MARFNSFYRFENELLRIYQRYGTGPFAFRDISDIITKRMLSQLKNQGYLMVYSKPCTGDKAYIWRLHQGIVTRCQKLVEDRECPATV